MKKILINLVFCFLVLNISAQEQFYKELNKNFDSYKEIEIDQRRFTHDVVLKLVEKQKNNSNFTIKKVGESIEGRTLNLISIGQGDIDVFLWSQMHGNESTATMAIFDIFNFLTSEDFQKQKEAMLEEVRLHFLPMLNPDGAERFQRRNRLGIDINRDALRLQSPEAKTLKRVRDSLEADFGFNLHDQSRYYNTEGTAKPATISFLAPAYNYKKSVNKVRGDAMKLIVLMNDIIQEYVPGQVARYNDDFEPRAFGDNIQKWGTSTILIESGGYKDDPEKQEIRKLNFTAILAAIFSLVDKDYENAKIEHYEEIPENDSKLFDLKLTGITYELLGNDYILDLGIKRTEAKGETPQEYYFKSYLSDKGDLSTNYAYQARNMEGYRFEKAKVYPETLKSVKKLEKLDFEELLQAGYAYIALEKLPEKNYVEFPVNLVKPGYEVSENINATFFLKKGKELKYAVINGFFISLNNPDFSPIKNTLILK